MVFVFLCLLLVRDTHVIIQTCNFILVFFYSLLLFNELLLRVRIIIYFANCLLRINLFELVFIFLFACFLFAILMLSSNFAIFKFLLFSFLFFLFAFKVSLKITCFLSFCPAVNYK